MTGRRTLALAIVLAAAAFGGAYVLSAPDATTIDATDGVRELSLPSPAVALPPAGDQTLPPLAPAPRRTPAASAARPPAPGPDPAPPPPPPAVPPGPPPAGGDSTQSGGDITEG